VLVPSRELTRKFAQRESAADCCRGVRRLEVTTDANHRIAAAWKEMHMNQRLYVGNLSFNTTEDTIRTAFAQFGEVTEVKLMLDRETGQSRGFSFVTMGDKQAAATAASQMNGHMLDGRALKVDEAQERKPRSDGGGSGSGGRNRW
jgi:RNA recognition motif-containing protein